MSSSPICVGPCREWGGHISPEGYGKYGERYAHRMAYEEANGPIPKGYQIDHLCRNRKCYNANHLEAVTQRVNILRGESPSAKHARQTCCIHGHEFDSTRIAPTGRVWRVCNTCLRERAKRRRALTV